MISELNIREILEQFIDDLNSCVDTHRLEDLLRGKDTLKEVDLGSKPEAWTRKHLIRRLLDAVRLEWEPEIYGRGSGYADFGITNLDIPVIGEVKSIKDLAALHYSQKVFEPREAAGQIQEDYDAWQAMIAKHC